MPNLISSAIANLSAPETALRIAAASEIYRQGRGSADRAIFHWWQDTELFGLLLGPQPIVIVGLAVKRETFARIHAANAAPVLAEVPPDQDALEFELNFAEGFALDVLTTKDPAGQGAIARYLTKFGEGVQQVEFGCLNVNRAASILRERFGVEAIYSEARAGAGGSKINFFLVPIPDAAAEISKVLIELFQLPSVPPSTPSTND